MKRELLEHVEPKRNFCFFKPLELRQIEVVLADFWTNRLLSSSSRSTAEDLASKWSHTRTLKSDGGFDFHTGSAQARDLGRERVLGRAVRSAFRREAQAGEVLLEVARAPAMARGSWFRTRVGQGPSAPKPRGRHAARAHHDPRPTPTPSVSPRRRHAALAAARSS